MTTRDGMDVTVYDTIIATQIELGDLIMYSNDYIEVYKFEDEGDSVFVSGYSHVTGDRVNYILDADASIYMWSAV